MGLLDNVRYDVDTPGWRQMRPLAVASAAGTLLCCDKRNDQQCDKSIYQVGSTTTFYKNSVRYPGNVQLTSPALAAAAAGGYAGFVPSFGIYGVLGAGCSTTKIVTSTALALGSGISALALNQLITTDCDYGFKIRIVGYASGKTEERIIVGNTESATPTIYLDGPLTFTPSANDYYEIQSGRVIVVAATTSAAGQTRVYGCTTNVWANGGATGVTTATAASGVVLDELYVPYDRKSGEGFLVGTATYDGDYTADVGTIPNQKKCLQATASAAGTLTGQTTGGDDLVLANEYRNFQIRIVEDVATPTAVGQRRIIASHTAGTAGVTAPIYTLGSNWSVTPSATAKYVIENPNCILLQSAASASMLTYNFAPTAMNNGTVNLAANTWSATYFNAAHTAAVAAGTMAFPCTFHEPITYADGSRITRHSYVYFFRGAAVLDRFDIAGAANGAWSDGIAYGCSGVESFGAGGSGDIDGTTWFGEYGYIVVANTNKVLQFCVVGPSLAPWTALPLQSATAVAGNRVCVLSHCPEMDSLPEEKLGLLYIQSHASTTLFRSDIIG